MGKNDWDPYETAYLEETDFKYLNKKGRKKKKKLLNNAYSTDKFIRRNTK